MKKNVLIAVLLTLAMSCASQKPENNNKMDTERLTYFSYDHHNSMSMSGEKYNVSTMKDGRIHVVIDEGSRDEKEFYLTDSTIFDELLDIVKTFKMDKYKENYKPRMEIFDGDSWSLYYKYNTRRSVSSGGYMAWPKNYREMRQALSEYFKKWREYTIGVLEMEYFRFTSKNNQGHDIEYTLERGDTMATVTIRDAEKGINKTIQVGIEIMKEFQQMANYVNLKSSMYDYVPSDENATFSTYYVRYNTGDTISGKTGYTQYMSHKESGIMHFFSRFMEEKE